MKVSIETIPYEQQRYETIGDYWWDEGNLTIKVTDLGDRSLNMLVAIHELIESLLCEERGIDEPSIMAFDVAVPDDSPYANDPGHDPAAPYHKEHVFAECVERLVAREFGVNWREYEAKCDSF